IHSAGGIAIFAVIGLATLAFVWRGMYAMSALQTWGFPLFVAFMVWALVSLDANHDVVGPFGWEATGPAGAAAMWSAMSLANGQMIFQGLMATDYGRFASQQIRYRGTAKIGRASCRERVESRGGAGESAAANTCREKR